MRENGRNSRDCVIAASESDYGTEFLDYIISVKVVDSIDEAIDHIAKYGTKHSEAIVTKSLENAERFQRMVDAAAVYVNASTRFTDAENSDSEPRSAFQHRSFMQGVQWDCASLQPLNILLTAAVR